MGKRKEIVLGHIEKDGKTYIVKKCTGCGRKKNLEDFYRDKKGLGGKASQCKGCKREKSKKYYNYTGERNLTFYRNGKKHKKCSKCEEEKEIEQFYPHGNSYVSKCKPCYLEDRRKGTGPKQIKIVSIEGRPAKECRTCGVVKPLEEYHKNSNGKGIGGRRAHCKECTRKYWKERREENKDEAIKKSRKWRLENPEKQRESQKRWRLKNREKDKVYRQTRQARKAKLRNDLTPEQWETILEEFNHSCALTGEREGITMDHFIPISTNYGGTYVGNVYPLSSTLNNSKHNRNPFEWYEKYGKFHNVTELRWENLVKYLAINNGMNVEQYRESVIKIFKEVAGGE